MCIIAYKPAGKKLFHKVLETCFINNPDGAGFSVVENGRLHTERGLFSFDDFMAAYEPHQMKQAVIHFRIRTHGNYEKENCHPYHISPNLVFAHNGVIYKMPYDKEKSDTHLFNELILKNLVRVYGKKLIYDDGFAPFISAIGNGSRFVFMDNNGHTKIVNESSGTWISDCWFSNDTWKINQYVSSKTKKQEKQERKEKYKQQSNVKYLPGPNQQSAAERQAIRDFYERQEKQSADLSGGDINHSAARILLLATGDRVRLLCSWNDTPRHAIGIVEYVFQNGDIQVLFRRDKSKVSDMTLRVPVAFLDKMVDGD